MLDPELALATSHDLDSQYPDATFYLRGDANASVKVRPGNKREVVFKFFCERLSLVPTMINHPTYHRFVGGGRSDSSIDVLLQRKSSMNLPQESLLKIFCSKTDCNVDSKHDVILSSFKLPFIGESKTNEDVKISAPTVLNTKHRIIWDEENLLQYQEFISKPLHNLQKNWGNPETPVSFSILLQCTNQILSNAAKATNKWIDLAKEPTIKKQTIPDEVLAAAKAKKKAHLKNTSENALEVEKAVARINFNNARKAHRNL